MKSTLKIAICVFLVTSQVMAQSIEAILAKNIGLTPGYVLNKMSEQCDLDISKFDETRFIVSPGMNASAKFMLFPDDIWQLNQSAHEIIYYENEAKKNFVKLNFDSKSLKITHFIHYADSVKGSSCVLRKF